MILGNINPYSFAAAAGPYTFNKKSSAGTAGVVSFTIEAGESIIVQVGAYATGLTFTVTDTLLNTYSTAVTRSDTFNGATWGLLYCMNPTPGAATITVVPSGGGSERDIMVFGYFGLNAFDAAASTFVRPAATTTDGVSSGNVTVAAQPAMLFAVCLGAGLGTLSAGTGFTDRGAAATQFFGGKLAEDIRLTSTTATPGTFTATSAGEAATLAAVFTEG